MIVDKDLEAAVERLMSPRTTTFDPVDALLLRNRLDIQSRLKFDFFGPNTPKGSGANRGPVGIGHYSVLHTNHPLSANSVIEIYHVPADQKLPSQTARIVFDQDTPTAIELYGKKPLSFTVPVIDFGVTLSRPYWTDWKTPQKPAPATSETPSEQPAS